MFERTVLDHGYVKEIESYGSDERIVESARMSTQKGFEGWGGPGSLMHVRECTNEDCQGCAQGDEKLLRFLYSLRHATPFEFAGLVVEVQAPIFVFREWHRHRVPFSYNEASARYAPIPDTNYLPTVERLMMGSDGKNKQAGTVKDAEVLTEGTAEEFLYAIEEHYKVGEVIYQSALKAGIPKEVARIGMPVGRYSRMRCASNLRGWLNFIALRSDTNPAAQWEIRQYGNAVAELLHEKFPRTMALYDEMRRAP